MKTITGHPQLLRLRLTRALRQTSITSCYRGVKMNDNVYFGFLLCGDCGTLAAAANRLQTGTAPQSGGNVVSNCPIRRKRPE